MSKIIAEIIETVEPRFNEIAPQGLVYASEKGFAIQHLKGNDYLMKAAVQNPESFQAALSNVAAVGLSLNPAEKLAYLIPRNVKANGQFVTKVFYEPSYMGLLRLATNSGSIKWCQSEVVREGESLELNGAGDRPVHTFNPFIRDGEVIGAYCVAKTGDGDYLTTTMTASELYAIRDRSESWKAFTAKRAKSGGPWQTDEIEQMKKTVIRRAFKTWPRSDQRLAQAVMISNENEGFEPIIAAPNGSEVTSTDKEYFDKMIEDDDHLEMFAFQKTTEPRLYTNLYHSFPKGEKGKWQRICDEMYIKGRDQFNEYVEIYGKASQNGDDAAMDEIALEVSATILEMIKTECGEQ